MNELRQLLAELTPEQRSQLERWLMERVPREAPSVFPAARRSRPAHCPLPSNGYGSCINWSRSAPSITFLKPFGSSERWMSRLCNGRSTSSWRATRYCARPMRRSTGIRCR